MIRKVLILSTCFVLAGTFPLMLPYTNYDADIFSDLELPAELKSIIGPESTMDLSFSGAAELSTGDYLENTRALEWSTAVDSDIPNFVEEDTEEAADESSTSTEREGFISVPAEKEADSPLAVTFTLLTTAS